MLPYIGSVEFIGLLVKFILAIGISVKSQISATLVVISKSGGADRTSCLESASAC